MCRPWCSGLVGPSPAKVQTRHRVAGEGADPPSELYGVSLHLVLTPIRCPSGNGRVGLGHSL